MEIISNIALISINETVVVQLISFLIFLFIINRLMIKPLQQVMGKREAHVKNINHDIKTAKEVLENLSQEIRYQEKTIRNEAYTHRKKIEASGDQKAATIVAAAKEEIHALRQKNQMDISDSIAEAREKTSMEAEALAVKIMEKVLDRRLAS